MARTGARPKKGVFITFEGPEGCGKSTHARLLFSYLKRKGHSCIFTREPGGTAAGEKIRKILLRRDGMRVNDTCELFLFEASRSQIVDEVIIPALRKDKIVICDRFFDATTAYQGCASGFDTGLVEGLNSLASKGLQPDITILLDIETREGFRRALKGRRPDRMESKSLGFHRKVRGGYLRLAKRHPARIKTFKTDASIDAVQKDIRDYITKWLLKK